MIFWTLQITIISIIFIFLIHHLIHFFKSTLTIPKIKDLVNAPMDKYEKMYRTIHSGESSSLGNYVSIPIPISIPDADVMKNELKSFLKKQMKGSGSGLGSGPISNTLSEANTTNIAMLDSSSGIGSSFGSAF